MFYFEETRKKYWRIIVAIVGFVFLLILTLPQLVNSHSTPPNPGEEIGNEPVAPQNNNSSPPPSSTIEAGETPTYRVLSITDGDTIRIDYDGVNTPVRLIGVDTPETVNPHKAAECFGAEASNYLSVLLSSKNVRLESDPTQSDRDKYDRLLRYVYIAGDNGDVARLIIENGYGYEYTYDIPYRKQSEYKAAESEAKANNRGLWAPSACDSQTDSGSVTSVSANNIPETSYFSSPDVASQNECIIKGNINNKGERIYHMPGQKYYNNTKIDIIKGEKYFCSKTEAEATGWRAAKV